MRSVAEKAYATWLMSPNEPRADIRDIFQDREVSDCVEISSAGTYTVGCYFESREVDCISPKDELQDDEGSGRFRVGHIGPTSRRLGRSSFLDRLPKRVCQPHTFFC